MIAKALTSDSSEAIGRAQTAAFNRSIEAIPPEMTLESDHA
jgi:hypothetical protein